MASLLRFIFLIVFALHWGGLTFYTGFVVRISHNVLSNPMDGGLITQRATSVLELLSLVSLVLMALNCVHVMRHSRRLGYCLAGCIVLLGLSLLGLFVVHGQLDAVIDERVYEVVRRDVFDTGHRRYKQLVTIHWVVSLAYLLTTTIAWKSIDTRRHVLSAHPDAENTQS
ncbi:MAG: hypothetical protein AAGD07_10035 [Planctomycetota bacterium]